MFHDHCVNMKKTVKTVLKVVSIIFVACLLVFVFFECVITQERQPEKRAEKPYYGQLKMAISTLDILQKSDPYESVFYSPHSIYWSTEYWSNILNVNFSCISTVADTKYILDKLKKEQPNVLISADKIFVSKTIGVE